MGVKAAPVLAYSCARRNPGACAGVKLRRNLGASQLARHDPFLMLDDG